MEPVAIIQGTQTDVNGQFWIHLLPEFLQDKGIRTVFRLIKCSHRVSIDSANLLRKLCMKAFRSYHYLFVTPCILFVNLVSPLIRMLNRVKKKKKKWLTIQRKRDAYVMANKTVTLRCVYLSLSFQSVMKTNYYCFTLSRSFTLLQTLTHTFSVCIWHTHTHTHTHPLSFNYDLLTLWSIVTVLPRLTRYENQYNK